VTAIADKPLSPVECWMVESNIRTVNRGEATPESIVETLRGNGYLRVAGAVEKHFAQPEFVTGRIVPTTPESWWSN
jgi:hypothetical protein